jgi:serine/threonine-protein kinase
VAEPVGRVLDGYRIEAEIGRGGHALVYRATELAGQRTVALKLLPAPDGRLPERLRAEAAAAARVDHPSVVAVHGAGAADGCAYLATGFVVGPTLHDLLRRGGPLAPARALGLLGQLAGVLDAAAARGVVHGDITPANVLVGPGDRAFLGDFGLARVPGSAPETPRGTWRGTPEYLAPELIRGAEATPAVDRYALAVVAYELLTGRRPFTADHRIALLAAVLGDAPPAPSSVRPALGPRVDAVLARALAKDPGERHPSAGALVGALESALAPVGPGE